MIILFCSFSENTYKENFIPKILKEKYRPLERIVRTKYEGFYDKTSSDFLNIFRKFGIL